jgi:hypothetical protein
MTMTLSTAAAESLWEGLSSEELTDMKFSGSGTSAPYIGAKRRCCIQPAPQLISDMEPVRYAAIW